MTMKLQLPPNFDLHVAEHHVKTAKNIAEKLFVLAEADATVEKDVAIYEVNKEEYKDDFEELEAEMDLQDYLESLEEDLVNVGGLCVVYLDLELRNILIFVLRRYSTWKGKRTGLPDIGKAYKEVFGIEFAKAPDNYYEGVQELCLARNCIIHTRSVADNKYLREIITPKLLGVGNTITIDRVKFDHCIQVFSDFLSFVFHGVAVKKGFELR